MESNVYFAHGLLIEFIQAYKIFAKTLSVIQISMDNQWRIQDLPEEGATTPGGARIQRPYPQVSSQHTTWNNSLYISCPCSKKFQLVLVT